MKKVEKIEELTPIEREEKTKKKLELTAISLLIVSTVSVASTYISVNINEEPLEIDNFYNNTEYENFISESTNYSLTVPNGYYLVDGWTYKLPAIDETKVLVVNNKTYIVDLDGNGNIIRAYMGSDGVYDVPQGYYLKDGMAHRLPKIKKSTDSAIILVKPNELSEITDALNNLDEENAKTKLVLIKE